MTDDRHHEDAVCGCCGGPLDVHRDAVCEKCVPERQYFADIVMAQAAMEADDNDR